MPEQKMSAQIISCGNDLAIELPDVMLAALKIEPGQTVEITWSDGVIQIRPTVDPLDEASGD